MAALIKFWPIWIPLIIYLIWRMHVIRQSKKHGVPLPSWKKPFTRAVLATLFLAILSMVWMGIRAPAGDVSAPPPPSPHLEDGRVVNP